jgi:hypothetical protein
MRWRWWAVLPVAVVLVLVGSASRLQLFWWPNELHDETSGRQGEPVAVVDRWVDEDDAEHERRFTVTLVDVHRATTYDGYAGPEPILAPRGVAVWEIVLEFDVDPDVPMAYCVMTLIDDDGREANVDGGSVGDAYLPSAACEPEDRRGPDYEGNMPEPEDEEDEVLPRPHTYRVTAFAVTADDAVPDEIRLSWEPPDFVLFDVTRP